MEKRLVPRLVGTTNVVRFGLALLSAAFVWIAFRVEVDTPYLEIVGQMVFLGAGLGATTAPALAAAKGWNNLVTPGVLVGVFGYALGTYLGTLIYRCWGAIL